MTSVDLEFDQLNSTVDALRRSISNRLMYGIRNEYGMFRQTIVDGSQVEMPDYWLRAGNPWEFPRPEVVYTVHFGGRTVQHDDRIDWIDTEHVNAMAYDTVIPGFATTATNT